MRKDNDYIAHLQSSEGKAALARTKRVLRKHYAVDKDDDFAQNLISFKRPFPARNSIVLDKQTYYKPTLSRWLQTQLAQTGEIRMLMSGRELTTEELRAIDPALPRIVNAVAGHLPTMEERMRQQLEQANRNLVLAEAQHQNLQRELQQHLAMLRRMRRNNHLERTVIIILVIVSIFQGVHRISPDLLVREGFDIEFANFLSGLAIVLGPLIVAAARFV